MPSNSEMYERGALDAEHDDLNTFYYQHYYYYRRGYDNARRQLRSGLLSRVAPWLLAVAATIALAAAGLAAFWYLSPPSQASVELPTATPRSTLVLAPTAAPPSPTPSATPAPTPVPVLHVGGRARVVNLGDSTLRARAQPSLARSIRIVARFAQGNEVSITDGPVQADGLTWWRIQGPPGEGWSAERSPENLVFLEALP
jgi:hypothetical protein